VRKFTGAIKRKNNKEGRKNALKSGAGFNFLSRLIGKNIFL
jgi:hypothetical protein